MRCASGGRSEAEIGSPAAENICRLDDAERPVADMLIRNGTRVPPGMLPRACRPDVATNELQRVTVLLDYGANLNDRDRHGHTALHYAVRGGKLPLIELLLERGADPNVRDGKGLTPLLHLVRTRSKADPIPIMELLVASGADIDARDERGRTMLMNLARKGNAEAVRWLVGHGGGGPIRIALRLLAERPATGT